MQAFCVMRSVRAQPTTPVTSSMPLTTRRPSAVLFAVTLAALPVLGSGCRAPKADAAIAEQLQQLGDELNAVRQDNAVTAEHLDSLRTVVARQDTLLRQIAGMAGVPVAPR
jgi:phospholipase/lecithinase/hemolysin